MLAGVIGTRVDARAHEELNILGRKTLDQILNDYDFILTEAAIVERLRRNEDIRLDPLLVHAPLIYSREGRSALSAIYSEYLTIAKDRSLPMLVCTPTWRANRERVLEAGENPSINQHSVTFLRELVGAMGSNPDIEVKIGGTLGCKNDCYLPEEALSAQLSEEFHLWQVNELASGGVDYLIAVTLPEVQEAIGLARAMAQSGLPYFVSFVVGKDGKVLDGTPLDQAIAMLDDTLEKSPTGYFVNCSYPAYLDISGFSAAAANRLIGFQANASSLSHSELEGASEVKSEPISEWTSSMRRLNLELGVKVLGGCCGTDARHLNSLVDSVAVQ
jgi:S-methylmethionine-dependent homocysteine/selenocysteine methylase